VGLRGAETELSSRQRLGIRRILLRFLTFSPAERAIKPGYLLVLRRLPAASRVLCLCELGRGAGSAEGDSGRRRGREKTSVVGDDLDRSACVAGRWAGGFAFALLHYLPGTGQGP
jgi:hypothetical protein